MPSRLTFIATRLFFVERIPDGDFLGFLEFAIDRLVAPGNNVHAIGKTFDYLYVRVIADAPLDGNHFDVIALDHEYHLDGFLGFLGFFRIDRGGLGFAGRLMLVLRFFRHAGGHALDWNCYHIGPVTRLDVGSDRHAGAEDLLLLNPYIDLEFGGLLG